MQIVNSWACFLYTCVDVLVTNFKQFQSKAEIMIHPDAFRLDVPDGPLAGRFEYPFKEEVNPRGRVKAKWNQFQRSLVVTAELAIQDEDEVLSPNSTVPASP
eukprot:Platyproteum_vivax@DN6903_c0_g1_i2.p1